MGKQNNTTVKRDLLFILWISFAVFLFFSLLSFSPYDPSLNSIGQDFSKIKNFCGLLGSFLSDTLYQTFGLVAWLWTLFFLRHAWAMFRGEKTLVFTGRFFLFLLSLCSLFTLHGPEEKFFENQISSGGVVGSLVVDSLMPLFSFYGLLIVLWATFLGIVLLSTKTSFTQWASLGKTLVIVKDFLTVTSKVLLFLWFLAFDKTLKFFKLLLRRKKLKPQEEGKILQVEFPQTKDIEEKDSIPEPKAEEKAPRFVLKKEGFQKTVPLRLKKTAHWKLPSLHLLEENPPAKNPLNKKALEQRAELLKHKLSQFKVAGEITAIKSGPVVTLFEFKPNSDVKISRITELADDLCLALSCQSVRILAPIPGRDVVGIETSNTNREVVCLKDSLQQKSFWSEEITLPLTLGKKVDGTSAVVDLAKMPHALIAGTTGSGKSVFVVSCIVSLIYKHSPETLKLILIDPKQVEFSAFQKLPHLLMPILKTPQKAVMALKWAIGEMEKRYRSMSQFEARDLKTFNEKVKALSDQERREHEAQNEKLNSKQQYYFTAQPYIVILIEEFGDLMAVDKSQVEQLVVRLAQMARACGLHLILAMQSPRRDVVTGLIKTNIPGRVSFKVASNLDSRIILDESGAERLLARGDMLHTAPGMSKPQRYHGAWVSEDELKGVLQHWMSQGEPEMVETFSESSAETLGSGAFYGEERVATGFEEDERYEEVIEFIMTQKFVSTSLIQRRFALGYPRAARLIELMEQRGVVGPANGSKPRKVLAKESALN